MDRLLIVGVGRYGNMVLNCAGKQYQSITFMTNDTTSSGMEGYSLIYEQETSLDHITRCFDEIIVAIDDNEARLRMSLDYAGKGIKIATIIHEAATVSGNAKIGAGVIIQANAIIHPESCIGQCCIIDNSAIIGHGCILHDGVYIASNVAVGRGVIIGEKTLIRVGNSIAVNVKIGANSVVEASSIIIQDVPNNVVVGGVPARILKHRE